MKRSNSVKLISALTGASVLLAGCAPSAESAAPVKEAEAPAVAAEKEKSQTRTMVFSCATSATVASAQVTGVLLEDVIDMDALEEGVNTVVAKSADGYGLPIPLSAALEKGAMLVYQINGKDLPASQGAPVQLWMPSAAKYLTRQATDIELTTQPETPALDGVEAQHRAKVSILNYTDDVFRLSDEITFEGYADDCGIPIAAIEFSMDGGETWTSCVTENASGNRWICWKFAIRPEAAGSYRLDVRARTAEGLVSPLAATQYFTVAE